MPKEIPGRAPIAAPGVVENGPGVGLHRLVALPPLRTGLFQPLHLAGIAIQEAMLTHHHPISGEVAATVIVSCNELVRGASWEDAIKSARVGRLPETRTAMTCQDPNSLQRGGFAPEVLTAAIHLGSF